MSEQTTIDGIDYGPLAALVGVWKGDKGIDRAPEPDGEERNPFMFRQARTTGFTHTLMVKGDEMRYSETTLLDIHDKTGYEHTDVNTLRRQR